MSHVKRISGGGNRKMEKKEEKKEKEKEKGVCKQTGQNSSGVLKEREESEIEDAVAKDCFERRGTFFLVFGLKKGTTRLRKMSCSVLFAQGFS